MTTGPVCVDEYKLLVHPRIAGHGPTLYQSGLPSTQVLHLACEGRMGPAEGRK